MVAIRPHAESITAKGTAKLARRASRLALRLGASLAGRRLRLEVEAVATSGDRQLVRRVGTVRVAG